MVNKSTVKTPGLLAAAVCKYSRSYNLKRRPAADSLQEHRGSHISDNQKWHRLMPPRYNNYLNLQ